MLKRMRKLFFVGFIVINSFLLYSQNGLNCSYSLQYREYHNNLSNYDKSISIIQDTIAWEEYFNYTSGLYSIPWSNGGFVFGTDNSDNLNTFAQGYINDFSNTIGVIGVIIGISDIEVLSEFGCDIEIKLAKIDGTSIYDVSGTTYDIICPGNIISSTTFNINDVDTTVNGEQGFIRVDFPAPIQISENENFSIIFDASNCTELGDTIGVYGSSLEVADLIFGRENSFLFHPYFDNWVLYNDVLPSYDFASMPALFPVVCAIDDLNPIVGETNVCVGSVSTYSVESNPNISNYIWSLPSGWSGSSSTNTIDVIPGSSAGTISVSVLSDCGASASQSINVDVIPAYEIYEYASSCESSYFWSATENTYYESGVYSTIFQNVYGCDSTIFLNLSINNPYFFPETHTICQGETYNWRGTDYTTQGIFTAEYQTVNTACDSIYQLTLTVNPLYNYVTNQSICQGESYVWRGLEYSEAGTYTETYQTSFGCDSIYQLILSINPLPQQVVVLKTPSNGILTSGTNGQISLSTSYTGTVYWVTMGAANFTGEIAGNGNTLSLGNVFPAGTYDIWSRNSAGCVLLQGTVTFVEDNGTNKITANVSFGSPSTNFAAGEVVVTLYKATLDIGNNPVVIPEDQIVLGSNGQAVFEDLDEGDYYLGSAIVYPANYNVASHVYYQTAITHEDAISIPVTESTIFVANLYHHQLVVGEGTNTGGGTVGSEGGGKSFIPEADMVVILRDDDAGEIIDVCVTNEDGEYIFSTLPDNTNIKMYVTSFEHQQWIPYVTHTATGQHYNVNFIVDGNSVYPDGVSGSEQMAIIETQIYPNPATNMIYILSSEKLSSVNITDINGRTVLNSNSNLHSFDISQLSEGLYFVKITSESGTVIKKFVKQ
ncbi:MAG: T9SS type A sorting domain-containing protein [Clostridia bacterium]|nr:T9SS type A sorting domain-containing protein [Clostridia bacterium]